MVLARERSNFWILFVLLSGFLSVPLWANDCLNQAKPILPQAAELRTLSDKILDSAPNLTPYIAHLVSEYRDDVSGSSLTAESGSGFIIACYSCLGKEPQPGWRFFLVTASHVSQGDHLKVDLAGGERARIRGRLADNLNDIEVIEIDRPRSAQILAAYDHFPLDLPLLPDDLSWIDGQGPQVFAKAQDALFDTKFKQSVLINHSTKDQEQYSYIPVVPWAKSRPSNASRRERPGQMMWLRTPPVSDYSVTQTVTGDELTFPGAVSPGMSGAPLLRTVRTGWFKKITVIDGVVSSKVRGFDQSYAASTKTLRSVLERYLNGDRGVIGATRWRYAKGVGTYRDFGEGTAEINPRLLRASNTIATPSGNGISSDGGNGVSSDGGNSASEQSTSSAPAQMLWRGKSILGFRIKGYDREKPEYDAFIFGNASAVKYLSRHSHIEIEPISAGTRLSTILKSRKGISGKTFVLRADKSLAWNNIGFGQSAESIRPDSAILKFDGSAFHLDLAGEKLHLDWNDQGAFTPIVRASSGGKTYEVDLHQIYFCDLAMVPGPGLGVGSSSFNPQLASTIANSIGICSGVPEVRVRDLGSNVTKVIPLSQW